MIRDDSLGLIMASVQRNRHDIELFCKNVMDFFEMHPMLAGPPQIVHSVKKRIKDDESLRKKIQRKSSTQDPITPENVFTRITDIAGVRVLHLYQAQFAQIHQVIVERLRSKEWTEHEKPTAYTWDPESQGFFSDQGLEVVVKESLYTSIHYVVKPRKNSPFCCEIQVRTLFEEIWGEIDHLINYPELTANLACRNQIGVLARLVGAGSRLADSICRTHFDGKKSRAH